MALGNALAEVGARGNDAALARAIAAYEAALKVMTRERDLHGWALTEFNLARAHFVRALRGDRTAVSAALSRARASLAAFERVGDTHLAERARLMINRLEALQ
jgi:hypothetical protein